MNGNLFTHEIVKTLGVISERKDANGDKWTREINIVSWNGRQPKIDIREWNADHSVMSKGATFNEEEAENVCLILNNFINGRKDVNGNGNI